MKRRAFITVFGSTAFLWPLTARAQQKAMPVIGFLSGGLPGPFAPFAAAFHHGLSEMDYVEGQNVTIEYRWAEGHFDRLPALAADLVGRKVDLIASLGGFPAVAAAKGATSTIPVVFETGVDPVAAGLVVSLGRPGGNLTGVSIMHGGLMPKRLELLSELVPQARLIALLTNPNNEFAKTWTGVMQEAASAKGMQLHILKAGTEGEIDAAFASLVERQAGALLISADVFFNSRREQLVALAARHAIPMMSEVREAVVVGGLISYGPSNTGIFRQLGIYAGKILDGAKPADLPVEQPTKFELVINLKTANTLGLTVPQSLLARADEVIE